MPTLKALSAEPARTRNLLSELFVKRAVMWMDFRQERVRDCIESLQALENATAGASADLSASSRAQDDLLAGLLQVWSGECKQARSRLNTALEDESDPINSGMDISAADEVVPALGEFRRKSFPAVRFLIDLLPDNDPVKTQALELVSRAEDELVRYYGVDVALISRPLVEPLPQH